MGSRLVMSVKSSGAQIGEVGSNNFTEGNALRSSMVVRAEGPRNDSSDSQWVIKPTMGHCNGRS